MALSDNRSPFALVYNEQGRFGQHFEATQKEESGIHTRRKAREPLGLRPRRKSPTAI